MFDKRNTDLYRLCQGQELHLQEGVVPHYSLS